MQETEGNLLPEGSDIQVKHIGRVMTAPVVDDETGELFVESYLAERYHLWKDFKDGNLLESYCDIDAALYDMIPDDEKTGFVKAELRCHVDSMLMAEKKRYG